ncbi:spore germination protein GerPC [Sutcliffiella deserti]|uniref:spore germination protein GerPC n=1 Tax=Sutcliffiella deserti TaxID=2875501 RepID=UPI001CC0EC23|nr:spore germination protein GerPC [Sutcliffiella deserti]
MIEHNHLEKRIEKLENQLIIMTRLLEKSYMKEIIHYHIKHLEIKEASIEQLHYHLDSIDIEQLTGTLNIGNNFGPKEGRKATEKSSAGLSKVASKLDEVKPSEKNEKTPLIPERLKEERRHNHSPITTMKSNPKGYTISLNKKEEER